MESLLALLLKVLSKELETEEDQGELGGKTSQLGQEQLILRMPRGWLRTGICSAVLLSTFGSKKTPNDDDCMLIGWVLPCCNTYLEMCVPMFNVPKLLCRAYPTGAVSCSRNWCCVMFNRT